MLARTNLAILPKLGTELALFLAFRHGGAGDEGWSDPQVFEEWSSRVFEEWSMGIPGR